MRLRVAVTAAMALIAGHEQAVAVERLGALQPLPLPAGCLQEGGSLCAQGRAMIERARTLSLSPDGRNVYRGAQFGFPVLARDPASGALQQDAGPLGCFFAGGEKGCAALPSGALGRVYEPAVSPDGRQVYVSEDRGMLRIYDRDPLSGALAGRPSPAGCFARRGAGGCTPARGLSGASMIALSGDGRSLYVAAQGGRVGDVAVFRREPGSGGLSQLPGRDGCVGANAAGCRRAPGIRHVIRVAVSPDDRHVYALSRDRHGTHRDWVLDEAPGAITVMRRARRNGALRAGADKGACLSSTLRRCAGVRGLRAARALAISPDGRSVYVGSAPSPLRGAGGIAVLRRDPASGVLRQLAGQAGCLMSAPVSGCARHRLLRTVDAVVVSDDGANVYATGGEGLQGRGVLAFARGRDGRLTLIAGDGGCVYEVARRRCAEAPQLLGASSLALAPEAGHLYVGVHQGVAVLRRAIP